MFENPAFYKSLANQRYMRVIKINYPNLTDKTKEKQEARSAHVYKCSLWLIGIPIVKVGYITFNQS